MNSIFKIFNNINCFVSLSCPEGCGWVHLFRERGVHLPCTCTFLIFYVYFGTLFHPQQNVGSHRDRCLVCQPRAQPLRRNEPYHHDQPMLIRCCNFSFAPIMFIHTYCYFILKSRSASVAPQGARKGRGQAEAKTEQDQGVRRRARARDRWCAGQSFIRPYGSFFDPRASAHGIPCAPTPAPAADGPESTELDLE